MSDITIPTEQTVTFRGQTLKVSPYVLGIMLELAAWLRERHINEAKEQMVGLPLELAKHAYDKARAEAKAITVGSRDFESRRLDFDGLTYTLYLTIHKNHPDFTYEDSVELFGEDIRQMSRVLGIASGDADPTKPLT